MTLKSKDYRKVRAANVWTRDVLVKMVRDHKHGFTTGTISEDFNITMKDAQMRVTRLFRWGCIRALSRTEKPITWVPTDWGLKISDKWKGEASPR